MITAAGRTALAAWLGTVPSPPRTFSEPVLRLLFADQAGPAELTQSLQALRDETLARHAEGREQLRPYVEGNGPFPERAHLAALFADLMDRIFTAYEE